MKILRHLVSLIMLSLGSLQAHASETEGDEEVILFAAASTMEAIEAIKSAYEARHPNVKIRVSYGASALLARQISKGAPADIFLSANKQWINWLAEQDKTISKPEAVTRNRLMMISPVSSPAISCPPTSAEIEKSIGNNYFVLADPNIVPLGQYSKEALLNLGLWQTVDKRLAIAGNATLAIKMIERGAAPLGIAYASNSVSNSNIRQQCLLPDTSHSAINYYSISTKPPTESVTSFTNFLLHKSGPHWTKAGFYKLYQNETFKIESK